jgi:hypothetical protein
MKRIRIALAVATLGFAAIVGSSSTARAGSGCPAPGAGMCDFNWSGYAAVATSKFTAVTGKWAVPNVTCLGLATEGVMTWVGMDGFQLGNNTEESGGTFAQCNEGQPTTYEAYWFIEPGGVITSLYRVYQGDQMQATVAYVSGKFKITVADLNKGHKQTKTVSAVCAPGCQRQSAEWIAEVPFDNITQGNLPEWNAPGNKLGFSACFATAGGKKLAIGGLVNYPIAVWDSSQNVLALPTVLGSKGQGFTDMWEDEN